MKRIRPFLIVFVLVAALAVIKLSFFTSNKPSAPVGPMKPPAAIVSVFVVTPEKLDQKIALSGTVLASEEAALITETSGRIVKIDFQEGATVSKGQLLVKINDQDLQASLKKMQQQCKLAKDRSDRQKHLLELGGVSQEDFDASQNAYTGLQADIEQIQATILKTEIRAPFNGVVGVRNVSEGSYINTSTVVASIQQIDPVKIDFNVPEKYAAKIHVGDDVEFNTAGSSLILAARISAIEPKVDPTMRTLKIRARCANPAGKILPGAFARIGLKLDKDSLGLMIPTEALIPDLKGQKVFLCKNGVASPQKVKTGIRTETRVQITEGLNPGDSVVVRGLMQVKPDALLKIVAN